MTTRKTHVNDSIQGVDENSWLVAGKLLLTRQPTPSSGRASWSDGNGGFFVLADAPDPLPETKPHPPDSDVIPRVYAAGDQAAVWRAGEAFIKAHDVMVPTATREHLTLEFLHSKGPLGFAIPSVLYHTELDERYFQVLSRVPGQTLHVAWPGMDEATREHYVCRVAEICAQLAAYENDSFSGVDGNHIPDGFISKAGIADQYHPQNMRQFAEQFMDVSSFFFYHCDLGPGNIIVDPARRSIGIIDWATAGYVPKAWIRTKFGLCGGLDLEYEDESLVYDETEWRHRVAAKLGELGFPDAVQAMYLARYGREKSPVVL